MEYFLTLLVSFLTWYFIEQPFRKSEKLPYLKSGPILCAIGSLLLVTSVTGYFTTLPLNRFSKSDYELLKITHQEAKEYQRGIDKKLRRRPFSSNDNKPNVAIIGDSYARDFMNILNEKGILDSIENVPFHINETWNDTFEKVMMAVVLAYFGGRTTEKATSIFKK